MKMQSIPNDIVVEVLLRLPAKSLVQFKWVCKFWFDLITRDNNFIKMHLLRHHHSTNTITAMDDDDDEILMSSSSSTVLSFRKRSRDDDDDDDDDNDDNRLSQSFLDYKDIIRLGYVSSTEVCNITLPLVFTPVNFIPRILGSCNGLILLYQCFSEILCIWNPCTKEYKVLPSPLHTQGLRNERHFYGLGYDHTTGVYKVIRNAYHSDFWSTNDYKARRNAYLCDCDFKTDVQVYTLGTNSWRRVDPNPSYRFNLYQREGVFANGALYWIDSANKGVISFDIGKEKFQHVLELPHYNGYYVNWNNVKLRVFEGSLCLVLNFQGKRNKRVEMWVMKDYAVNNNNIDNKSSWTKLSSIPNLHYRQFPIKPLSFTPNGEILVLGKQKDLLLYDPKNHNVRTLCRICEDPCYIVLAVYTESLVSLNSGTYTGQERSKE